MNRNDNYIKRLNDGFGRFAQWVVDHRLIVLIACLIMGIGGGALGLRLQVNNSLETYFMDDDPSYVEYKDFKEEYGNDEFLYIVYRTKQGIFNMETLGKTKKLVEDLEKVPYVQKVNAITNIECIEGSKNGDLKIYGLMDEFPSSQVEANLLMQKLLDKPLYVNAYISGKGDLAAILCEMEDNPTGDPGYYAKIRASLKSILSKPDYNDFEFWPVGLPVIISEFNAVQKRDISIITPFGFFLAAGFSFLFFRQMSGVIGISFIGVFAMLLVLGFMAVMDIPITAIFLMTPPFILAVGVANGVHFINEYQNQLKAGCNNRTSIIEAVRLIGTPCLFTALTTVAGFSSITVSPIRLLREYGFSIVFGVMAIFFFSLTILLVILSFARKKTEPHISSTLLSNGMEGKKRQGFLNWMLYRMLHRIVYLNKRHYGKILGIAVLLSIIAIYGITKIQINSSWLERLGDNFKVYHDHKFSDQTLGGSENFEILLNSEKPDGVKTFQFVQTLEKIQNFADAQDYLVKKTVSITDIIKDVNRSLHGNDKAFYRLPSSDEDVSQQILLYEIAGGDELEKRVSADVAVARLTIYTKSADSTTAKRFYDDLATFIEAVKPADYTYKITGVSFLYLNSSRYIVQTQTKSIMLATAIISVMMIILFRSVKIGLLSMLPNIFPIFFILGFMGFTGIWLDSSRSLIACIAIGLVIDDTIYLIGRYQEGFARLGNYEKALDTAMNEVGRAITITTVVMVSAFCCGMISRVNDVFYYGPLVAGCLFIALLADYFIGPSLMLFFKPFGKEFDPGEETEIGSSSRRHKIARERE